MPKMFILPEAGQERIPRREFQELDASDKNNLILAEQAYQMARIADALEKLANPVIKLSGTGAGGNGG